MSEKQTATVKKDAIVEAKQNAAMMLARIEPLKPVEAVKLFGKHSLHLPKEQMQDDAFVVGLGKTIRRMADRIGWYVGDFWVAVQNTRSADKASAILEACDLTEKTAGNYAWTARRYTPKEREEIYALCGEGLSFAMFTDLAAYPQPARLKLFELKEVKKLGIGREEIRLITSEAKATKKLDEATGKSEFVFESSKAFNAIVHRLEKVDPSVGTVKELKRKLERAIKGTTIEASATVLSPEHQAEVAEATEALETAKAEVDELVKEKADLKEIAEAKAEVARAEIELQQARTRSVTVPAGSTVNPNEPVVVAGDHPAAWLDKIKADEASDIRTLAKRLNEDLHNMKAQIDRMAILIDGRVQAFAVDPHWRNNLKDCGSKLFDMLKGLPLQVSELGGRIATASSVHDAHTLKADEKVTPLEVSKIEQANERDNHLDAQEAKAERRKAARAKAATAK